MFHLFHMGVLSTQLKHIYMSGTLHIEWQGQLYKLQLSNNWHYSGGFHTCDYPSAMCYFSNQCITYNLAIHIIVAQALSEAIYITSFYMCLLAAYIGMHNRWLHDRLCLEAKCRLLEIFRDSKIA